MNKLKREWNKKPNRMSARIEKERKPNKCPNCSASPVASILYGYVGMDSVLEQKIEEGRVSLGGCCEGMGGPVWECTHCGLKIYQKLIVKKLS
ncbi:hypothetical protein [Cycloclasticus zancles]|jgi:DNA-directed RNA polymerase subunit RPC12/RpoP|uniref:Zn-ribbon protein n=1 Tax=Cycloclasticus zancles 78-ME TaxID=1198232 RepID=S5U0U0_9GAMM|nr:hypothetical protein [Cycloclasticus zancles]AGS38544.1 Zn-ribbon protein [Cycloclasticus zancles 78-ME]AGS40823.1 hypothetical protein CYCME_2518 [Cycloclasticus zancles 78-ME]MDF1762007.1 hypothetical protein [Thalassolituus sp.]